ncbi:MAG: ATP-grasp domain-containing protein [Steroidobacteraceae bacterium]
MNVYFVVPFFMEATLRFVEGAAGLEGVRLSIISQDPIERLPQTIRARIAGHWRVDDGLNPVQIAEAARQLARHVGAPDRIIGSLEQLQVPLAEVRGYFGLAGPSVEAARNFRDKSTMKTVLERNGLPCARHRLAASTASALQFVREVGLPVVVKPPAGAGAVNTFRLDDLADLERYLERHPPSADRPVLVEEFLRGEEFSFDAVLIEGRMVWYSISNYRPAPLTVLENPWIQWCVLLPREIEGAEYDDIRRSGYKALRVLGLETGMSHMEWFRRADGGIAISEAGARPPGAQFTTLISYAHDLDFYSAWPRLVIFGAFDAPERRYATGAAYVRGLGTGRVKAIHGLEQAQREIGSLVVASQLPKPGQVQAAGYEGAGYVILRHPQTAVVEAGLKRVIELLRIELA